LRAASGGIGGIGIKVVPIPVIIIGILE